MRRTLAALVVVAALSGVAACGDGGSPDATTGTTPAGAATTGVPAATEGTMDPACTAASQTITDSTAKIQQELGKAATASDADLDKARQTVKRLYTDIATAARSAAGKADDAALKTALTSLAAEATKVASSLDTQRRASTALALMDRAKVTAAVQQVQQVCGET